MPYSSPIQPLRSPSSPTSSSTSSLPDLSDSFVIIPSDDEAETESTSTINTALLDELSDTSSEPRHPGSLEGSFHGDLSDAEDDLDFPRENSFGGSYADAEATASLLTDSRTTLGADNDTTGSPNIPEFTPIPRPTMRGAGSEFRFIFPNPEASFSSSGTFSGGPTPSGSIAQLLRPADALFGREVGAGPVVSGIGNDAPFARLSVEARQKREKSPARGVDEGWLKDARTWAPTHADPVAMLMPSWEKGQYDSADSGPGVSDKVENKKANLDPITVTEEVQLGDLEDKTLFFPAGEGQQQLKCALRAVVAAGAGTAGNRWGLLAFASCALAILGAFGPGMTYMSRGGKSASSYNVTSPTAPALSARGSIPLEEVFTSIDTPSTASCAHTPRSLATQLIPDLQTLRDAISTFTSGPKPAEPLPQEPPKPCCSGSGAIERPNVALSPSPKTKGDLAVFDDTGYKAWIKAMSSIVGQSSPVIPPAPVPEDLPPCNCSTAPSLHVDNAYAYLLRRTRDYALSTSSAFAQLYHPMMLHLDYELRELARLATYVAERNITRSALRRIHAAGLGARQIGLKLAETAARQRTVQLDRLYRVADYTSRKWAAITEQIQKQKMAEEDALHLVLKTAHEGLGRLVQKTEGVKNEGERSIRQAKKGLEVLIKKAQAEAERIQAAAVAGSPADWAGAGGETANESTGKRRTRQRFTRTGRVMRERRSRRQAERMMLLGMQGDATVAAERPAGGKMVGEKGRSAAARGQTKWRRLLEVIHHGAVQVVLQ